MRPPTEPFRRPVLTLFAPSPLQRVHPIPPHLARSAACCPLVRLVLAPHSRSRLSLVRAVARTHPASTPDALPLRARRPDHALHLSAMGQHRRPLRHLHPAHPLGPGLLHRRLCSRVRPLFPSLERQPSPLPRRAQPDASPPARSIYLLNLFLAFLTPKFDPALASDMAETDAEEGAPGLPSSQSDIHDGEFRPFIRRLPEFKFWYAPSLSHSLSPQAPPLTLLLARAQVLGDQGRHVLDRRVVHPRL